MMVLSYESGFNGGNATRLGQAVSSFEEGRHDPVRCKETCENCGNPLRNTNASQAFAYVKEGGEWRFRGRHGTTRPHGRPVFVCSPCGERIRRAPEVVQAGLLATLYAKLG